MPTLWWVVYSIWNYFVDFYILASLGSASNRARFPDLAGDRARDYLRNYGRVRIIPPPDHDLTNNFRSGHDLHS